MLQKQINKSRRFAQCPQIANDSKVAKIDSSLHASRSAQNDDRIGLPRFSVAKSRNDKFSYLHLYQVPTQGKGAVMAYAFSVVEADIFIMIDADLECDTSILPRALQVFSEQNLDMLNIARLANEPNIYRKGHKFGNALFTKIAQILFGKSFKDLLSGYRIFSRAFVKSFPATSKGFEIETELSVFALQCQMRIGEISAPYRSRVEGSFSKLRTFRDGFKILAMIVQLLFTERPLFVFGIASLLCFVVALILGVPLVVEFIETSKVPRFPTAFICVGFGVIGVVLGIAGLLAHLIGRNCKEMRRFFYLLNSHKSTQIYRHTEGFKPEVSKSSEPNQAQSAMTKEQINESHRFAQSQQIANDSKVAKMDSSPTAQNDEFCKDSSLRGVANTKTTQTYRHTERSEVSKS